uniref:Uncharacterized protein n=1 Tax=Romanomermis culicivorax TaxID=13658 RepID=A0A915JQZ0_ROMCU
MIYINRNCYAFLASIIYPAIYSNWYKYKAHSVNGDRKIMQMVYPEKMSFLNRFHEVNLPIKEHCDFKNCSLFVSAFDPVLSKMKLLSANHSPSTTCNLTGTDLADGQACLTLKMDKSEKSCLNFYSASVTIRRDDVYYLIGHLASMPHVLKSTQCDQDKSPNRKFYNFCDTISTSLTSREAMERFYRLYDEY